jgi:hypothetical protein
MHLYSVEFQWFSTRDIERDSGGGGMLRLRDPGGQGTVKVPLQTRDYVELKTSYSP